MGIRQTAMEAIEAVMWVADLLKTSISPDDNDVVLELAPEDESGVPVPNVQSWGIAGVQSRPKDGSDGDGYAKAIRVQLGEFSIVIATHDPRHVEPCEPGELVVHALGKDGARRALLRLKPDGSVDLDGTEVVVGNPDGTLEKIALGDAIKSHFDAQKMFLDTHTHTHPMGPTGPVASPSPTVPVVGSSKHKVET